MGKGKKKNPGKGIDFKRVRGKVGKKLPKAQNLTDTTIRSRAINLPGQNLRDQEETEASGSFVSSRNLNLKELLSQTGHYSDKVRRDAITGLGEILGDHPQEVRKAPQEVLEKLAARMTDADSAVRKSLAALLRDVVLPALRGCDGAAFLPMVMAHLSSAMTHIADPIRNDALLMLEVIMGWVPGEIVDSYLSPCLAQFSHLLSHSQRGKSVQSQSIASLYKASLSLHSFLRAAANADTDKQASQAQHADPYTHQGALFAQRSRWPSRSAVPRGHDPQHREGDAAETGDEACRNLLQRLMECWMECAPGHMSVQPEEAAVQCMAELLGCINLILARIRGTLQTVRLELAVGKKGKKKPVTVEETFLQLVAPHFPAAVHVEPPPPDGLKVALSLVNIRSAQLLERLLPRPAITGVEEPWFGRLVQYWAGVCRHGHVLASSDLQRISMVQAPESSGVSEQASAAALSGFREVLFKIPAHHRATLVAAVGDLADRSPSRSSARLRCLQFQRELLARAAAVPGGLAGAGVAAAMGIESNKEAELISEEEAVRWLAPLPRLLWELGSTAPAASEAALELLLLVGRLATPEGRLAGFLDEHQTQLLPLYMVTRSSRRSSGSSKGGTAPSVPAASPGPLAELPSKCQKLAVDLLWYFPSLGEATLRSVALMALSILGRPGKRSAIYPPELGLRAAEIVIARCQHGPGQQHTCATVEPKAYLSFLLSLLIGTVTSLRQCELWSSVSSEGGEIEDAERSQRRCCFWTSHSRLVKLVSETIASTPAPCQGGLLGLLVPALLRDIGDSSSSGNSLAEGGARPWFGLLSVAAAAEGSAGVPDQLRLLLPEALVSFTLECAGEKGDIDQPLPDHHPGMAACTRLLVAIPSLLEPCFAALREGLSGSSPDGPGRLSDKFEERQSSGVTAAARFIAALCGCGALREELLDHGESLCGVTAVMHGAVARYGSASEDGSVAAAASRQAGMLVDTMLGSL